MRSAATFGVLGTLEVVAPGGRLRLSGRRQRELLGLLLAARGSTVPAEVAIELLWREDRPAHPAAALHSQVARLRRSLDEVLDGPAELVTRPPGYALVVEADEVDALRFERLVAAARDADGAAAVSCYDDALALWRGRAFAELGDLPPAHLEGIRLDELRLAAVEERAAVLVESGRAEAAVPELEAFVAEHPLREEARATLMRALYATGRQSDALAHYQDHRRHLAEELGLEPSVALQHLEHEILGQDLTGAGTQAVGPDAPEPARELDAMRVRYVVGEDGHEVATATVGSGPHLVVVPAWVTSLDIVAAGRDPRASLVEQLSRRAAVTLYDRRGTGLTGGDVEDFSLAASVRELVSVLEARGRAVLVAVSQAGPVAVAAAAERPDLVAGLVLFGTFADARSLFGDASLNQALVDLARANWGMGAKALADLYRPGCSLDAGEHLARVLRDSAPGEVAAGYLEEMYRTDVTDLLGEVAVPSLVLHYRGDRVIPHPGGQQLARGLPDARLVTLDGRFHLPDAADLTRIVDVVADLTAAAAPPAPRPPEG